MRSQHTTAQRIAATTLLAALTALAGLLFAPTAEAQTTDEIIDALTIVAPDASTAIPAAAPVQPTPTPRPTAVPQPTPLPTAVPQPTPIPTAIPQPTPIPAPTPAPVTNSPASFPADVAALVPQSTFRWLESSGWNTLWLQGPGPGRQAEAQYATRTIVIWRTSDRPTSFWAGAFAHELGHAVSFTHLSKAKQNEWTQMRGLSSWSWVPGMPNDFSVGEGDFAEAFMNYLIGHAPRSAGGAVSSAQRAWIQANTPF